MARTDDRFRAAYNALLDYCATLAPGAQLPTELALSAQLDVSRTVIRTVLTQLHQKSILHWDGRDKVLLREVVARDHLAPPSGPVSTDVLERQFLDWVLRFDVAPGTALNVTDLSRKFQVPAYALQEFLASLSRFDLVRRRPRGGWVLVGFTPDYAVELSDFRAVLELNALSQLLTLPADHAIWPQLAALADEHHQLAAQIDTRFNDFSPLDERFHATIGSAVRNRFATEFQKVISLVFHYHFQWDKSDERDRNLVAIHQHLRVIEALQQRNEADALAAARTHLQSSKQTLLASLRSHTEWIGEGLGSQTKV